jgi:hypothetical protein
MLYRGIPPAIYVADLLIGYDNLASFMLCGLIVEVVSTIGGCCRWLNTSISNNPPPCI